MIIRVLSLIALFFLSNCTTKTEYISYPVPAYNNYRAPPMPAPPPYGYYDNDSSYYAPNSYIPNSGGYYGGYNQPYDGGYGGQRLENYDGGR
jgi:hypothetical protein